MSDQKRRGGWSNPAAAENGKARGGRKPGPNAKATIQSGDGLMLSHVTAEGTADLGGGIACVEAHGRSRLIKIPQADGSEIRILIPR